MEYVMMRHLESYVNALWSEDNEKMLLSVELQPDTHAQMQTKWK